MKPIINSRADLDAIQGTPEHANFMKLLKGTIRRVRDDAVYPENYFEDDYDGPKIDPIVVEIEDLTTIERFGFTRADFIL